MFIRVCWKVWFMCRVLVMFGGGSRMVYGLFVLDGLKWLVFF